MTKAQEKKQINAEIENYDRQIKIAVGHVTKAKGTMKDQRDNIALYTQKRKQAKARLAKLEHKPKGK